MGRNFHWLKYYERVAEKQSTSAAFIMYTAGGVGGRGYVLKGKMF